MQNRKAKGGGDDDRNKREREKERNATRRERLRREGEKRANRRRKRQEGKDAVDDRERRRNRRKRGSFADQNEDMLDLVREAQEAARKAAADANRAAAGSPLFDTAGDGQTLEGDEAGTIFGFDIVTLVLIGGAGWIAWKSFK